MPTDTPAVSARHRRPLGAIRSDGLLQAQKQSLEMVVRGAPLADVLEHLTRVVEDNAPDDVVASILLMDEEGRLHTGAAPSLPPDYNAAINGIKAAADVGTCAAAAATRSVVLTQDIDRDPNWADLKALPLGQGLVAAWSQPILARDGRVLGTFGTYFRTRREPDAIERVLVETLANTAALAIERARAEAEAVQQHRMLELAFGAAEMGAWRYDLLTRRCEFEPRARRLHGLDDAEARIDDERLRAIIHPGDIDTVWAAAGRACDPAGERRYEADYRVRGPDGEWRWLRAWGQAEFETGAEGLRAVRIAGASRDITAQKEAERQRELLVGELNHRVKNTLAVVQSIAAQTLRSAAGPDTFNDAFTSRLSALARAHSLLAENFWDGAPLPQVVEASLSPFVVPGPNPVVGHHGPPARVDANIAVMLSLVLHELATNAAKYGALSVPTGRVQVTWGWRDGGDEPRVELLWSERDGPRVSAPSGRGFGSRLLAASPSQLGGEVEVDYRPEGVACRICFAAAPIGRA